MVNAAIGCYHASFVCLGRPRDECDQSTLYQSALYMVIPHSRTLAEYFLLLWSSIEANAGICIWQLVYFY
ncbi:MAG TPA: hypothetical protein VJ761_08790 [Ktedonobacteraceae bacterium]|nr:hypothetical protein [Ktedonobacteraceae bacterium]